MVTPQSEPCPVDTRQSPHAKWRTLPSGGAVLHEGFWSAWQAANRSVALPHGFRMLEEAGNFHDLRLASGQADGSYRGPMFMDSDIYKWLEGAAFQLAHGRDAELEEMADRAIDLLKQAQAPDGYLDSYVQAVEPDARWTHMHDSHELYCAGHLIQAAVAYERATGQDTLLSIACRFADCIDGVFGPGKRPGTGGHPEIETALVELYRETREGRYLRLAQFFIDERGHGILGEGRMGAGYMQDHVPVREATAVDGHAVRQLYLTAGVTDLYLETGEPALVQALLRQWHDMVHGKLYLTGGVGSRFAGEAFGDPYELPNDLAYCETCAAIASIMWSWRMLMITGEGRFADLMERTLYNGFLSGVSLDGRRYFYINPLASPGTMPVFGRGGNQRAEWHSCACCPPNVMRLLASLGHYVATSDAAGMQVHHYAPALVQTVLSGNRPVSVRMETEYPWEGLVQFAVEESDAEPWALALRVPSWCEDAKLFLNGVAARPDLEARGYVVLNRAWHVGDTVSLDLPMPPRLTEGHPRVAPTHRSVAIERGPLVYCLEECDHESSVMDAQIDVRAPMVECWRSDLLRGVVVIEAEGQTLDTSGWSDALYRPLSDKATPVRAARLTAVPYYAWANRKPGAMRVWIPRA